jgi:hypothetical protein
MGFGRATGRSGGTGRVAALPLSPARGPPRHDRAFGADPAFDLDQTPAQDPTEPEPVPDFDFVPSAGA